MLERTFMVDSFCLYFERTLYKASFKEVLSVRLLGGSRSDSCFRNIGLFSRSRDGEVDTRGNLRIGR